MFHDLLPTIAGEFSGKRAWLDVSRLWQFRNTVITPGLREACRFAARRFKENGIDTARLASYAADGKTRYGERALPLEWQPGSATLSIVKPPERARRLTSFEEEALSLVCGSAATPKKGVEAEVVIVADGTREEHYAGLNVKGKIVMTDRQARAIASLARKHGAIGIISDTCDRPKPPGWDPVREAEDGPDAVQWSTFTSHGAGGDLFGFVLSPRMGRRLRVLIEQGPGPVVVRAEVDAKSVKGHSDVVDAVVPGGGDEELWVLSHISEPGARDNASGCATSIEIARTLRALTKGGKLPRMKRSVRFLFSTEVTGFLPYLEQYRRKLPGVIAGICLDSVGLDMGRVGGELVIYRSPEYAASFVEHLMADITHAVTRMRADYFGEDNYSLFPWRFDDFWGNDAFVTDPYFDIPSPQVTTGPHRYYHTSLDRPEQISPDNLGRTGVICATFLYFLACAGRREAAWLAAAAGAAEKERIARALRAEAVKAAGGLNPKASKRALGEAAVRLERCAEYWGAVGADAVGQPMRLCPEDRAARGAVDIAVEGVHGAAAAELGVARRLVEVAAGVSLPEPPKEAPQSGEDEARRAVPTRQAWRPPPESGLPKKLKQQIAELRRLPGAKGVNFAKIWPWADGRRSVYDIWRRIRYAQDCPLEIVATYFDIMAKAGSVVMHEGR